MICEKCGVSVEESKKTCDNCFRKETEKSNDDVKDITDEPIDKSINVHLGNESKGTVINKIKSISKVIGNRFGCTCCCHGFFEI